MVAITYGIRPWGSHPTGWMSPRVIGLLAAGAASIAAFTLIERRVAEPMFRLGLFRIRAFTFGSLSTFLSAVARGGLMFILIIWLQGIWLPQHGYDFVHTPLWAGIYMLPLTLGMLVAGPTSGYLSDRFGARPFATGGMIGTALSFVLLLLLPTNFSYPLFAAILALTGISMGLFASPNRAAVMNSLPRERTRRRRRHEPDLPELRSGDLDRHLLHADDRRPVRHPPAHDLERPRGARRRRRAPRTTSRACRRCRSCSPPSSATTRSSTCSGRTRSPCCRHTTGPWSPGARSSPT